MNMATNNPNVAGKRHRELMAGHYNRLQRMATDTQLWLDQVEQAHHDYYGTLLRTLQESSSPEDEELFDKLDREYSRQMCSVQAARERITEATAHIKNALLAGGQAAHLTNVTPETFQ